MHADSDLIRNQFGNICASTFDDCNERSPDSNSTGDESRETINVVFAQLIASVIIASSVGCRARFLSHSLNILMTTTFKSTNY
jgi:hypothetical protein